MMDEATICNMALSHVGVSTEIQNMRTERSKEAQACRRFFDVNIDEILRDFPWPFARRVVTLTLVEEDPTDEWAYSYRWPDECITPRRILSGTRLETAGQRVPFVIAGDDTGSLIYTDMPDAQLEYTRRVTDIAVFTPDFSRALSYLLAAKMGPRFGSEATKLANRAWQFYANAIEVAKANALNAEQRDLPIDSEFVTGR